jgi:hypothetical protein
MERNTCSATEKPSDRSTAWGALGALALGAVLGGTGMLCSRWVNGSPLLCTALQSAFSTMVLAVLTSARQQDLALDVRGLQTCTEIRGGGAQEARCRFGEGMGAQLACTPL